MSKEEGQTSAQLDDSLLPYLRAAAALLLALMLLPALAGRIPIADDLGGAHLPLRRFFATCLANGDRSDWLPAIFSGFFLLGEGQAGTWHPFHLLIYRLLPLPAAYHVELLASTPIIWFGTNRLLGRWRIGSAGAIWGATAFAFSAFNLLHYIHINLIAVVAHIPWIVLAIDIALRDRSPHRRALAWVAVALLTGSQLLLGHPQAVWLSIVAEVSYCVATAVRLRIGPMRVGSLVPAKCAGVLVGCAQLIPTLDGLGHSTRATVDAVFGTTHSLHPLNLYQLVAPYLLEERVVRILGGNTHEFGLYTGAGPLVLCAWLLIRRRRLGPSKPLVLGLLVTGFIAFLLATGKYGGIYRLMALLPGVGFFRVPSRFLLFFHFATAVLSAIALVDLDRVAGGAERIAWRRFVPIALLPVSSVLVAALALRFEVSAVHRVSEALNGDWRLIAAGPLVISLCALLVILAARGRLWALPALVLVSAADLGAYGLSYGVYGPWQSIEALSNPATGLPEEAAGRVVAGLSNTAITSGHRTIDGYVGLFPRKLLDYDDLDDLRLAGVEWVSRGYAEEAGLELARNGSPWLRIPNPLARIRMVSEAQPRPDPPDSAPPPDPRTSAWVEEEVVLGGGAVGQAELREESPGRMLVGTNAQSRQLLVVAESFHPGWTAEVDGRATAVLRVNRDFIGCVVEAGEHEIRLVFDPPSRRLGLVLSALGMVWVVLQGVWLWCRAGAIALARG
ncbi:MAG: hypothetical protein CME06_16965 [Gemmatimonadetes bacterium]|nr:hypothetical protein [Gemmatimonadota bacterium]